MAKPMYDAYLSDWNWNEQYQCYFRYLQSGPEYKYIWPEDCQPQQQGSRAYEQPRLWPGSVPLFSPGARQAKHAAPKCYTMELGSATLPGPVRTSMPFSEIPASSRIALDKTTHYIMHPMRYFRPPSKKYTKGYCDHPPCNDPRCIENQIRKYGWRDDLRHHEDQDKNGNMRDGDKVGEHCPPTANGEDEEDEDNGYGHTSATHHAVSHSAIPYSYYPATPRHDPYSASTAGLSTAPPQPSPASSISYYASPYGSHSQSSVPASTYLTPGATQYRPYHTP